MNRTPSSARWITRSVLIAVAPTYCPTRAARSTSTRWPFWSKPTTHLPAQVAELLNAAERTRYAALFELLVHTGLRRGETLSLLWADVDFERGTLRVRGTLARIDGALVVTSPKTAKSKRVLPLSAPAERLLRDLQEVQATERERAGSAWRETGYCGSPEIAEASAI